MEWNFEQKEIEGSDQAVSEESEGSQSAEMRVEGWRGFWEYR